MFDLSRKCMATIMDAEWAFRHSIVSEMPQAKRTLKTLLDPGTLSLIGTWEADSGMGAVTALCDGCHLLWGRGSASSPARVRCVTRTM